MNTQLAWGNKGIEVVGRKKQELVRSQVRLGVISDIIIEDLPCARCYFI